VHRAGATSGGRKRAGAAEDDPDEDEYVERTFEDTSELISLPTSIRGPDTSDLITLPWKQRWADHVHRAGATSGGRKRAAEAEDDPDEDEYVERTFEDTSDLISTPTKAIKVTKTTRDEGRRRPTRPEASARETPHTTHAWSTFLHMMQASAHPHPVMARDETTGSEETPTAHTPERDPQPRTNTLPPAIS